MYTMGNFLSNWPLITISLTILSNIDSFHDLKKIKVFLYVYKMLHWSVSTPRLSCRDVNFRSFRSLHTFSSKCARRLEYKNLSFLSYALITFQLWWLIKNDKFLCPLKDIYLTISIDILLQKHQMFNIRLTFVSSTNPSIWAYYYTLIRFSYWLKHYGVSSEHYRTYYAACLSKHPHSYSATCIALLWIIFSVYIHINILKIT